MVPRDHSIERLIGIGTGKFALPKPPKAKRAPEPPEHDDDKPADDYDDYDDYNEDEDEDDTDDDGESDDDGHEPSTDELELHCAYEIGEALGVQLSPDAASKLVDAIKSISRGD